MKLLKKLCDIRGASGDEHEVKEFIKSQIEGLCDIYEDKAGDLVAFKKGRKTPSKMVMYAAHMDEVGYMVKAIEDDGSIKIDTIGVSPNVSGSKRVYIKSTVDLDHPKYINGVFSLAPIHVLKPEELSFVPDYDTTKIDIGTDSKEETEKLVELGDYVYFENSFGKIGKYIKSKAFDDRAGCYVMIKMIQSELEYDSWFAFTTREEIGKSGADSVAYAFKPYLTFILEGTTAADIAGQKEYQSVCKLDEGPVISFMDLKTVYDPALVKRLTEIADKNNIKWQYKSYLSGGNDADGFQRKSCGGKVLAISLPVRYCHSQLSVASFRDLRDMVTLSMAANKHIEELLGE